MLIILCSVIVLGLLHSLANISSQRTPKTFTPSMGRAKITINHLQELGIDKDILRHFREDLVSVFPTFVVFCFYDVICISLSYLLLCKCSWTLFLSTTSVFSIFCALMYFLLLIHLYTKKQVPPFWKTTSLTIDHETHTTPNFNSRAYIWF